MLVHAYATAFNSSCNFNYNVKGLGTLNFPVSTGMSVLYGETSGLEFAYLIITFNTIVLPWLLWRNGLSASLRTTKGSPVRFPVRAHAWVAGRVPSRGRGRGNYVYLPHCGWQSQPSKCGRAAPTTEHGGHTTLGLGNEQGKGAQGLKR